MKRNRLSRQILYIFVISMLAVSPVMLTGCSGQMENLFTRPQKVTIEHNATVEPTPTPTTTPTPTPTPTPMPTPTAAPEASTSSSSAVSGTDPAAGGSTAASNTTAQAGQEAQPELPEGTLEPVGVTKEEADAAAEAMHEKVIEAANYRLDNGYYSKETLISGLMEDGFSYEEATYGAEHCYIDWGY